MYRLFKPNSDSFPKIHFLFFCYHESKWLKPKQEKDQLGILYKTNPQLKSKDYEQPTKMQYEKRNLHSIWGDKLCQCCPETGKERNFSERERERFRREKSGKKVMSFHLQKSEANKNEWIGRLTFSRDCLWEKRKCTIGNERVLSEAQTSDTRPSLLRKQKQKWTNAREIFFSTLFVR